MFKLFYITAATFLVAVTNAALTLSDLPDYKYFKSEINPNYGVRFVSPQLCDPNVTQYAGYLDMGSNHYHFWFFESKQNPMEKPLTAYVLGGPGCSGQIGVWSENSPCKAINNGTEIEYRELTWTHVSNMLYIDQPSGTGFSYGDRLLASENEATIVFYEALQLFYEAFPKYFKLPFHIFGESLGGRTALTYAKYIIEQNLKLKVSQVEESNALASRQIIPLNSIGVMSGIINPLVQFENMAQKTCKLTYGSKISPAVCQLIEETFKICETSTRKCYETENEFDCASANAYCAKAIAEPYFLSKINFSDMRVNDVSLKIPSEDFVKIIERPDFRKSIGAYSKKFVPCSNNVSSTLGANGHYVKNTAPTLEAVLDYGIPVLVVSGDSDYLGNWYGIQESLSELKFNGSESYNQLESRPWFVQNKKVGEVQGTDKLTFVLVYGAGHIISDGQPENALILFDSWINRKGFLDK